MNYHRLEFSSTLFVSSLLFWILRMVLPGMKFIFVPIFVLMVLYFLIRYHRIYNTKIFFVEFLKTFSPLFLLFFFYVWGIFNTNNASLKVLTDFTEFIVGIIYLFIYYLFIHSTKRQETFIFVFRKIVNFIGVSALFVALLGLFKYYFQIQGYPLLMETPAGSSINTDKNFYALYSFLGIFSFIQFLLKEQSFIKRLFYQGVIFVLLLNIILSYSYRALFILPIFVIIIFSIQLTRFVRIKNNAINLLSKNTRELLVLFFISFFLIGFKLLPNNKIIQELNKQGSLYKENSSELALQAFHIDKWQFAFHYFNDQDTFHKLFGSGFNYLEVFGQHYNKDASHIDYPHNPILSALLYSGIAGAVFALLFLIISVYYAIIYFKTYPLFSLMLFISLLFVFFSGNSLFSVPVFLFLFSLSFLIRHQEITDLHIDLNLNKPGSKLLKEVMDYVAASIAFLLLFPMLLMIGLFILVFMGWPIFYTQTRVGQNGKTFRLIKFRTMNKRDPLSSVAAVEPDRISVFGNFLRTTKLDELPELWNIIQRDMSFVGPRPDVPGYADSLKYEDQAILTLKPGLTGPASLKYINEDELLSKQSDPQKFNDEVIFPDKVRINLAYMKYWSLWLDFKIIIFTALRKPLNEEYFK